MPLSKRQFELGVDAETENWMGQIYDLLAEHRGLAYSHQELLQAVRSDPQPIDPAADQAKRAKLDRALDVLVRLGAVDKRAVSGTDYYAFHEDFDTDSWQPTRLISRLQAEIKRLAQL